VFVATGVFVTVEVCVRVGVFVTDGHVVFGVLVDVAGVDGVLVGVAVLVIGVGVSVGVDVSVAVGVSVGVSVGVDVDVPVFVGVAVFVTGVAVFTAVFVGQAVGVCVAVLTPAETGPVPLPNDPAISSVPAITAAAPTPSSLFEFMILRSSRIVLRSLRARAIGTQTGDGISSKVSTPHLPRDVGKTPNSREHWSE
jgi:hypothetical protein